MEIMDMLNKGAEYKLNLVIKKKRLYDTIKAVHGEYNDELYSLAGVQLEDYEAFETFVLGILDIYNQTIHQSFNNAYYDFRTPALKLTFDFQKAVKLSHQNLKFVVAESFLDKKQHEAHSDIVTHSDESSNESVVEVFNDMLKEVSHIADRLEQEMKQNMIVFSTDEGNVETVLKLEKTEGEELVNLVDQDNNEYVMMKPFDTTVIVEDVQLIYDLVLILITSFVLGWMFTWIDLPAFFGYILAGIVIGPSGYNLIQELVQIETLSQLGVVFIMFVLGLEFSLEKIKKMWRLSLGGAIMILLVTVLFFITLGVMIDANIKEAVFVGVCISLSSTAVVIKCIKLDQLDHLYGLLVMQDVILGFMLAMIPVLSKSGTQIFLAILRISFSFAIFGFVCFGILRLMPVISFCLRRFISIQKNHEIILLGTIAMCMSMLILSVYLGLGMELGCFAAGVILRSRKGMFEVSIKVIEPIRDMFACLFFTAIGLHIYPSFLASEAMLLFTLAGGVIGFKYIVTCIILYLFKFDLHKSSTMAIALAQISEFGFVLASRAKQLSIVSREVYYILIAITSITLIATPVLLKITAANNSTTTTSFNADIIPLYRQQRQEHNSNQQEVISIPLSDTEKLA
ncbi:Sodium/hydrogen exchanger family-domain-containing protein [Cokeromyces recurvatus]|uniref:Sodium/hydrogen exchanger family-domain-containing protein n=1 Tax=Cokeromyces recurvatus TaxID=90255 RepID=UPI00221E5184|nr:Sodium/hydrogen exchanger family-domain-containing protein [Cokeromyces recurvatus]KAI7900755.1 Sodium/hydrogen exchanger family-domain-containing protein [Cokeromyces recurvatus]